MKPAKILIIIVFLTLLYNLVSNLILIYGYIFLGIRFLLYPFIDNQINDINLSFFIINLIVNLFFFIPLIFNKKCWN